MTTVLSTLDYFTRTQEECLECLEWDIREASNYDDPTDLDFYTKEYGLTRQRLDDLELIKSIVEGNLR
jgi:hypothetical protein